MWNSFESEGPIPSESQSTKLLERSIDKGLEVKAILREIKELSELRDLGPTDENDRENRLIVLKAKQKNLEAEVKLIRRLKEYEDRMREPEERLGSSIEIGADIPTFGELDAMAERGRR